MKNKSILYLKIFLKTFEAALILLFTVFLPIESLKEVSLSGTYYLYYKADLKMQIFHTLVHFQEDFWRHLLKGSLQQKSKEGQSKKKIWYFVGQKSENYLIEHNTLQNYMTLALP